MDLQTKKIHLIQEVLRLKNEEIINKLEKLLFKERKKLAKKEIKAMTIEDFNSLIDQAEDDSMNNRLHQADEILKDIDTWK